MFDTPDFPIDCAVLENNYKQIKWQGFRCFWGPFTKKITMKNSLNYYFGANFGAFREFQFC